MNIRRLLLASLLASMLGNAAGCGDASSVIAGADSAKPAPKSPPSIQPSAIYTRMAYPHVKYLLFPRGQFELHYGSFPAYQGGYLQTDSTITFDFVLSGCSIPECSKMVGTAHLRGDTLFVQYDPGATWLLCSDIMDFEVCDTQTSTYLRSQ